MKPLILLIHTQEHVNALPETAKTIIAAGFDRCWVIISPAIAVDTSTAAEKLDSEITALRSAERAAADRADYDAANGHKIAREGKMLDRDKAIADAWKSVPDEDRKVAYQAKLGPLFAEFKNRVAARVNATQEHYAAAQWISMLNSLSGVWPKDLVHGEYVVAWPGAIPALLTANPVERREIKIENTAKSELTQEVERQLASQEIPLTRRDELEATHHMSLRPIAKALGIDVTGKGTPEIIDAIIEAEINSAGKPAADLAAY